MSAKLTISGMQMEKFMPFRQLVEKFLFKTHLLKIPYGVKNKKRKIYSPLFRTTPLSSLF
jgi:hypothetical protein